jgi:hypothetical protein
MVHKIGHDCAGILREPNEVVCPGGAAITRGRDSAVARKCLPGLDHRTPLCFRIQCRSCTRSPASGLCEITPRSEAPWEPEAQLDAIRSAGFGKVSGTTPEPYSPGSHAKKNETASSWQEPCTLLLYSAKSLLNLRAKMHSGVTSAWSVLICLGG